MDPPQSRCKHGSQHPLEVGSLEPHQPHETTLQQTLRCAVKLALVAVTILSLEIGGNFAKTSGFLQFDRPLNEACGTRLPDWAVHPQQLLLFIACNGACICLAAYHWLNRSDRDQNLIVLPALWTAPIAGMVSGARFVASISYILGWTILASLVLSDVVHRLRTLEVRY